jgi:membrane fusion protein (multidrug efflux system)
VLISRSWLLLFTAFILGGCSNQSGSVQAAAPAPALAVMPRSHVPPPAFETSGPVIVENQVDVAAQREGVVASILVDVAARVKKGDLLAQLDDRQLSADREAADAKVKSLTEDLKHWEALRSVREADLSRSEEMWKYNIISAQQVEHDRYTVIGTKYEIARQQQDLRNAQESLRSLEVELEKTRIRAPFDGVVARRYIRVGQRIANNDRLFWVSATGPLIVKFTLPQDFIGKIHPGDEIHIDSPSALNHTAKVRLISPVVDPASSTIEVQAQVHGEPADLAPGMTVSISVPRGPSQ